MTVTSHELGEDGHTTRGQRPGDILHEKHTDVMKLKVTSTSQPQL